MFLVLYIAIIGFSFNHFGVTHDRFRSDPLMSNHQAPLRQQKGYSIIELSIALAIISIILVTALAGVQRILRSNNVNSDLRGLNLTAANLASVCKTAWNPLASRIPSTPAFRNCCVCLRIKPFAIHPRPRSPPRLQTW